MSLTAALAGRISDRLPGPLGQRIRWLFALFTCLVAALAVVGLPAVGTPIWPHRTVAVAVLVALGVWAWAQYRTGGLPGRWDLVPISGVFTAGWLMGHPAHVFGLMFVLLYGRALYGPAGRVWMNAVGYFLAYEAALVTTQGPGALELVRSVTVAFGVAFSTGVMWLLGDVIRTHQRASRRARVLATAASRMQRATDHDAIYAAAVDATLELVDEVPDAAVSLWRGDADVVRVGVLGGDVPDGVPLEVPLAIIPDDLRQALLAREPFALDEDAAAAVLAAVGVDEPYTSILIAPLSHGDTFSGALAIGSREPLPADLVASLGRLGTDVGLALDRADSTTLLGQVVENSSDAILLLDGSLDVDFASPAVTRLLGYRPDDLAGRSAADLIAPHGVDLGEVLEQAASASERNDPQVLCMVHRDGSERSIELAAVRLADTRRRGWVVNLRDVTSRVHTERALRDSEQRFRALAENVTEGLYEMALHPHPRFVYVNPAMERMTGFAATRFLDDPELTLRQVHPDDRPAVELTRTTPDSVSWPVEVRWQHPGRGWRWLSFEETVEWSDAGTPISSMGIVSDITARKEQEEALRKALMNERRIAEELRQVDTMKTTFLQAVSHELRTPLTAITGYAQTLHRGGSRLDDDTRTRLIERLEVNAGKLDRLLSDLLDLDRMTTAALQPHRRRVDVAALCRRVIDQVEQATHVVTCTRTELTAEIDPPKVERIVENLVRNAIKYTEPGTPITVDALPSDEGDGVVITVEDRGPGIPEHLHEDIFDPFVQGPRSIEAANPGTGIGLALVARFAELHGGRAWIEQPHGGGTRFHVQLPGPDADRSDADPHQVGVIDRRVPRLASTSER